MNKAFIFDMDGVIVDSNPYHKIALQQFCKQLGYDLTEAQLREKIYGRTNKDWISNLFGDIGDARIQQYAEEKEALYRQVYDKDIRAVNGLVGFLEKMDALGIARAIATSAPRSNVDFSLSKTHTERFFPTILDDSFVSKGKPDPEIYLKSAAALGYAPADCIVFEDSLSGVQAGKQAGCKVVGITTTHSPEELHETDFIIHDFAGLEPQELISKLF
ncbi:HAD family hydrolase [Parachryseolinea silvisoli]|jgi:beta-phosphoglucomutase|uniref:HAD family hydrolase n=1 Tax=Parachryseolinea silvisoli TaxID=2873601 RepID=UPI0022657E41|nr:HAD family phosphatase [Parachryseolinea silvisoli]MCD9016473.1 HAD family phosphatase [Parachryseolinea silvisoli]